MILDSDLRKFKSKLIYFQSITNDTHLADVVFHRGEFGPENKYYMLIYFIFSKLE